MSELLSSIAIILKSIMYLHKKIAEENARRKQEKKDKLKVEDLHKKIDLAFDTGDEELLNEISDS